MTASPNVKSEAELEDSWFAEPEPISTERPVLVDAELDGDWFARGRPLSSRPPPPDASA